MNNPKQPQKKVRERHPALRILLTGAGLFMAACGAQAQLLVDVGTSTSPVQAGYVAFTASSTQSNSATNLTSPVTGIGLASQTYSSVNLGGGGPLQNVTVAFSGEGWGGYNQRQVSAGGFAGVTNTGGTETDLLSDCYFARGTLNMTLTGLTAGTYVLVTDNRSTTGNQGGNQTIQARLTDATGTATSSYVLPTSASAADAGFELATYTFTSNGTDAIVLRLDAAHYTAASPSAIVNGPNNAVVNGFSLTMVPEPGSTLLVGMGATVLLVFRRLGKGSRNFDKKSA